MIRVGSDFELLRLDRLQSLHPHSSRYAVLAALDAFIVQRIRNPRRSIALPVAGKNIAYTTIQLPIRLRAPARAAPCPVVISTPGYAQNVTHEDYRPGLLMLIDESIPHELSFAKKAVAFFNMSFSIRSRRFSVSSS